MPVPPLFAHLVDDAAIFPPGNAPMATAVRDHLAHRQAWYAGAVGPLLCSDVRLPELCGELGAHAMSAGGLAVAVIVTRGAGGLVAAVRQIRDEPRLSLAAVEVPADPAAPVASIDDIAAAVLEAAVGDDIPVYVEVPPADDEALAALAGAGLRAKLRTGGESAEAFPSETQVSAFILRCLHAGVRFKCTAGLHEAVRHRAPDTGLEHHGFLNLLVGVRTALDGGAPTDVVAALSERSAPELVRRARRLDEVAATAVRAWMRSYGSCSIAEPVDELVRLGLLTSPPVVAS